MPPPLSLAFALLLGWQLCLLAAPWAGTTARAEPEDAGARPRLSLVDITTDNRHGQTVLSCTIAVENGSGQSLQVPILIRTGAGDFRFQRTITAPKSRQTFILPDPPLAVILDPDHETERVAEPAELAPSWSRFLAAPEKTVVPATTETTAIYAALLNSLGPTGVTIIPADRIRNDQLSKTALLFLGNDNAAARTLFSRRETADGFTLEVHANPLDRRQVAVLVSSSNAQETAAAVAQLGRFGAASLLRFKNGVVQEQQTERPTPGLEYVVERLPDGSPVAPIRPFDAIIDRLAAARVIYIGETHTAAADHLLQFRIVQALYRKDPRLAIGMEMFPRSSQQALDAFTQGDGTVDERDFLKKSHYFKVWGYDWRLFRDTFNFARLHRLPVIGLNLDREIVHSVFTNGGTDRLSPEQQRGLPADRDLDMPGYADRLGRMYAYHGPQGEGRPGPSGLSGYIQAQGLWDESMAEAIAAFLARNPSTRLVVLAGTQHIRKDSGIPPRVARRLPVAQISVLNILSDTAPADVTDIADFIFLQEPTDLPPAAQLGVILEQTQEGDAAALRITGFSPHGKAREAGLQENDILLAIGDYPVYTLEDVRIAMIDAEQGETITVRIRRGSDQEVECKVTARTPTVSPHP